MVRVQKKLYNYFLNCNHSPPIKQQTKWEEELGIQQGEVSWEAIYCSRLAIGLRMRLGYNHFSLN